MILAWTVVIVFAAAVLQALTGFGFALVAMPLVTLVLDLPTAAPLIALAQLTANTVHIVRSHRLVNLAELVPLGVAAALGIPLGIWALAHVSDVAINRIVGVVMLAYAGHALLRPARKQRLARVWAYPAGFAAGCLGGAYNTPGPPVVIYGSLRQWPKDEYRATVQAFFFVNAMLVVGSHLLAHHVEPRVLTLYVWVAPALLLGLWVGARLDRDVDQKRFRTLVTTTILLLGLSMLIGLGRR